MPGSAFCAGGGRCSGTRGRPAPNSCTPCARRRHSIECAVASNVGICVDVAVELTGLVSQVYFVFVFVSEAVRGEQRLGYEMNSCIL